MNKYYNKIIIVFCVALYGAAANAADGYMGLDIAQMNMSFNNRDNADNRFAGEVSPIVIKARIGIILLPDSSTHLSIESHLGFGVSDTSAELNSSDVNMRLESLLALYLKADMMTLGPVSVFGLVGYATVQSNTRIDADTFLDSSGNVKHLPETESGTSFGFGFNYFINKDWSWQVEYLDVVQRDSDLGFDVTGLSVGVSMVLE